jgi:PAS domain S-box-containing protein
MVLCARESVKLSYNRRILRYGMAPVFLALAVLLSELLHPIIPSCEAYIFLAAVALSAWFGGRVTGLIAAFLALYVFDYFFLPPLFTLGISAEALPYVIPFGLSAVAAAWMSSTRSQSRKAAEDLRHSEDKFRRILKNLPDVAWTADQTGCVIYMSPKIEEMTGYSSQEIYAGGLAMLFERTHPEDVDRLKGSVDDLFSRRSPFDIELRHQRKDGKWIWVHIRSVGAYEENGIILADGVVSDVSWRRQAELDLQAKTAFLEAQVNSTIDGILVVGTDGRRILHNQRLMEIFRIPPELLTSTEDGPLLELVLSFMKDPKSFLAKVGYLYSHPDETSRDELELKDGRIFDRYSAPVIDKNGGNYGRIWNFRDITERRRNEDRLRQLSAAVEQSSSSIVITDLRGTITYVNPKFTEVTGYTFDEAVGQNPRILKSGSSPRETFEALWTTIRSGKEWRGELRNKRKNGEIFLESAAITPIVDGAGNITHFLGVKEDITTRRQLESELRQAQKLEGIGQLAAGIAHEINTPTQFVTDNLTFLQEAWETILKLVELYRTVIRDQVLTTSPSVATEVANAEQKADFEFVASEVPQAIAQGLDGARRVASIVRAMKEFSHPDSAEKTEADLNKGITSTVTIARNEWKYVAELVTDLDESLRPIVCYPGEVNQVILNLIVNSAHSIKEKVKDGEKGRITISTRQHGPFAEIAISDTGMGIPEAIQHRIYEPFFTTKEVGKGTGQGLAFAHSVIVKKHQGKIWFETKPGHGTTFFIQLPMVQPAAEEKKR